MDNDVKALVEEWHARTHSRVPLTDRMDMVACVDVLILGDRLAAALSAREASDAEKRDAALEEAAKVAQEHPWPTKTSEAMWGIERSCIAAAILSLRTKASAHE